MGTTQLPQTTVVRLGTIVTTHTMYKVYNL